MQAAQAPIGDFSGRFLLLNSGQSFRANRENRFGDLHGAGELSSDIGRLDLAERRRSP
jgi:hypothetical protein